MMTAQPHDHPKEGSPLDQIGAALSELRAELDLLREAMRRRDEREDRNG